MFYAGMGAGFVITAMTVKLIFANSALPGYFIIAFPIFYCPCAFALYGGVVLVVRDPQLAFVMLMWSFWPVILSIAASYHGFHHPMSDERVLFMANYLLVFYYF